MNEAVRKFDFPAFQTKQSVKTGLNVFDRLTDGLPKGGICEITGKKGTGKRSLVISLLACLTSQNKICAIVDTTDSFDPVSAQKAGVNLDKILWIQCDNDPQKAIIATDYIIQSGLLNIIWLDMSFCDDKFLQKLPAAYWYRFKVGLLPTPTSLIVTLDDSKLKSAAHHSINVVGKKITWLGNSNFRIAVKWEVMLEMRRPHIKSESVTFYNDHQY